MFECGFLSALPCLNLPVHSSLGVNKQVQHHHLSPPRARSLTRARVKIAGCTDELLEGIFLLGAGPATLMRMTISPTRRGPGDLCALSSPSVDVDLALPHPWQAQISARTGKVRTMVWNEGFERPDSRARPGAFLKTRVIVIVVCS